MAEMKEVKGYKKGKEKTGAWSGMPSCLILGQVTT